MSIHRGRSETSVPMSESDSQPFTQFPTQLAGGAGMALGGKLTGTGLRYLSQMLIARLLGADSLGLYALGLVVCQLAELFARMGLQSGVMRYVSIYHGDGSTRRLKGVLLYALVLPLVGGGLLSVVLVLTANMIAIRILGKPELAPLLRILGASLPFGASMTVAAYATTGFLTTKYLVCVREMIHPFANLALIAILYFAGFGVRGAAVAWFAAAVIGWGSSLFAVYVLFPPIRDRSITPIFETRDLLRFSLPLVASDLMVFILVWTDTLMLGYFVGASDIGVYRAASQTALLLSVFITSLNVVFAPMLAGTYSRGDHAGMQSLFKTSTRWSILTTLPFFVVIGVAAKDVLRVFGPGFAVAWIPLIVLASGQLVNAGTGSAGWMLVMSGHQYLKLAGDLGLAGMNILMNLLLIPRMGVLGAAVATGISIATVNLLRLLQVRRTLRIQPYDRKLAKVLTAGTAAFGGGFAVHRLLAESHFLVSLLASASSVIAIYVLVILIFRLDAEDRHVLAALGRRIQSRSRRTPQS